MRSDGIALSAGRGGVREWRDPAGAGYVEVSLDYVSPSRLGRVSIHSDFLTDLYSTHKTLGQIEAAGRSEEFVFDPSRVYERRATAGATWRTAASFIRLGIEHIFTGYDHIAFLIGLLLLGGSVKTLIKIVTAFTLAHSATLALAALDVIAPAPRIIEPLIAASIVFIGLENLVALRRGLSDAALRHRWLVTLGFGLVHGFGFASVLRELQLPRAVLATGLVSFNLGVECGQVVIVLAALPVLRKLRTFSPFAPAASACIAALGAVWLVQRLIG
jgi:hydrogenase/urease accessory protein HupE